MGPGQCATIPISAIAIKQILLPQCLIHVKSVRDELMEYFFLVRVIPSGYHGTAILKFLSRAVKEMARCYNYSPESEKGNPQDYLLLSFPTRRLTHK